MDWETRAFKCKVNFENLTSYSIEFAPSTSSQSKKPQEIKPKTVSTPITSCTSQNPTPTSLKHKAKSSPSLALPKPQTSLATQTPNSSKPHAQSFELHPAQATTLASTSPHKCTMLQEFFWIKDTHNPSTGWKVPMELLYAQGYGKR